MTFHNVRAAEKVAVDPRFVFDLEAARAENREARYHEVTSDHYFGQIVTRTSGSTWSISTGCTRRSRRCATF